MLTGREQTVVILPVLLERPALIDSTWLCTVAHMGSLALISLMVQSADLEEMCIPSYQTNCKEWACELR